MSLSGDIQLDTRELEFYNTFKHYYEISSYLNLTRKTINRKALVKLRVSNNQTQ